LKVPKSTTRGMIKISAQGNIYQSGKRVDLEVCGLQGDGMYSVYRVWLAEWYVCNWLYKL
jgi:hypothetical protein